MEDIKLTSPEQAEEFAVSWFAAMWNFIDESPHWPVSRSTLAKLISAAQYTTSAEHLAALMEEGHIPRPRQQHGQDLWDPASAIRVVDFLERTEHWQRVPSIHDTKKTQVRRDAELAEQRGDLDQLIEGLDRFEPLHLIDLIVRSDDLDNRRTLRDVLVIKRKVFAQQLAKEQGREASDNEDEYGLGLNSWREFAE